MTIGDNFASFQISSKGMSVQRKKMDLIAENIANTDTTKMPDGLPYRRKTLSVTSTNNSNLPIQQNGNHVQLKTTSLNHFSNEMDDFIGSKKVEYGIVSEEKIDTTPGQLVYMPDHPDADKNGYVVMPNVNVVTEMIDMITATRTYEANLTAFNSAKQMAKDALDI
jgi:flagellar basal-body rod protein FlgC